MQSDRPKKEKTKTMRAITLDDFDSFPGLREDLPVPSSSADDEGTDALRALASDHTQGKRAIRVARA
jgi:hypothetical protein